MASPHRKNAVYGNLAYDLDEQHIALLTEYEKTFDLATVKAAAEAAGFEDLTGEPRLPPHLQALVGKKGA